MPTDVTPNEIPEAELPAYFATANRFLSKANDLAQTESRDEVAAAFLYACARYNAFAMQAQGGDPTETSSEFAEFLVSRFAEEVREHMTETLSSTGAAPQPGMDPKLAIEVLDEFDSFTEAERKAFYDLGDAFVDIANAEVQHHKAARISAAMMHACTRFNVFVMQSFGHAPGMVDPALVTAFTTSYRTLLQSHMKEMLIAPKL
ncbi:MAG: DUF3144 domain-containing protein [Pseudomonadota bacterium]